MAFRKMDLITCGKNKEHTLAMITHMHENWERYKGLTPHLLTETLFKEGIIPEHGQRANNHANRWKARVEHLDSEGLWTPLRINDVNGWLSTIKEPIYLGLNAIKEGKAKAMAMKLFLKLLGGQNEGNIYSSPTRGIIEADLMNAIIDETGRSIAFIRINIIDELISDGALRRATASPRIIMIPTKEQAEELEKRRDVDLELFREELFSEAIEI